RRRNVDPDYGEQICRIRFDGDLSTPFGITAAAEGMVRLYSYGRLPQRRYEMLMRGLRVVALGRFLGNARPLRLPDPPSVPDPPDCVVITADTRPYDERKRDLEAMQQRLVRGRMVRKLTDQRGRSEGGNPQPDLQVPDIEHDSEGE